MYTSVTMTEQYQIVQRGEQHDDIEEAKKAARRMNFAKGQMPAVLDENNLVMWKGGAIKNGGIKTKVIKTTSPEEDD